ncbi:MAG: hypothetical protein PHF84_12130 [bacterium]|nr:hypothetical protein [bacterium]
MKNNIIPDLLLERFICGEVSGREKRLIEDRLRTDPDLQKRLHLLNNSDKTIRLEYPSGQMAEKIKARYEKSFKEEATEPHGTGWPLVWMPLLRYLAPAAVCILILVLAGPALYREYFCASIKTTIKGSDKLCIFRQKGNKSEILKNNDLVRKGDVLQLAYLSEEDGHGVIFSLDGRGNLTLHYPYGVKGSSELVKSRITLLKESYRLDDAPRFEVFFFITSQQDLSVKEVLKKAGSLRQEPDKAVEKSRDLFKPYRIRAFTLRKG